MGRCFGCGRRIVVCWYCLCWLASACTICDQIKLVWSTFLVLALITTCSDCIWSREVCTATTWVDLWCTIRSRGLCYRLDMTLSWAVAKITSAVVATDAFRSQWCLVQLFGARMEWLALRFRHGRLVCLLYSCTTACSHHWCISRIAMSWGEFRRWVAFNDFLGVMFLALSHDGRRLRLMIVHASLSSSKVLSWCFLRLSKFCYWFCRENTRIKHCIWMVTLWRITARSNLILGARSSWWLHHIWNHRGLERLDRLGWADSSIVIWILCQSWSIALYRELRMVVVVLIDVAIDASAEKLIPFHACLCVCDWLCYWGCIVRLCSIAVLCCVCMTTRSFL